MDLRPITAPPTTEERDAVDALLETLGGPLSAPAAFLETRSRRHLLLPALQAAQGRRGYVSPGALGYICERLGVPPAEAYGVASFYALLSLSERPPVVVHVCDDVACQVGGAEGLCAELHDVVRDVRGGDAVQGAFWPWSRAGPVSRAPPMFGRRTTWWRRARR